MFSPRSRLQADTELAALIQGSHLLILLGRFRFGFAARFASCFNRLVLAVAGWLAGWFILVGFFCVSSFFVSCLLGISCLLHRVSSRPLFEKPETTWNKSWGPVVVARFGVGCFLLWIEFQTHDFFISDQQFADIPAVASPDLSRENHRFACVVRVVDS